jgi:hypothetical protein
MWLCLAASLLVAPTLDAQGAAKGNLVVGGAPIAITHAYAYADKSFNEGKDVVVVVHSDAPIAADAVQSEYACKRLVDAGSLHYVELLVGMDKQALHYEVQHHRFGMYMQPGGSDDEHAVEITRLDGTTIAGRAWTTSPQESLDHVPYAYDVTFSARIAPARQP